jgi:tRNA(fMet)-specific endonuclease VapC
MIEIGMSRLSISAVAAAELHVHINSKTSQRIHREQLALYLGHLKIEPFNKKAAEVSGVLQATRQSKGSQLPAPDYMIAGHALSLARVIVTDNTKHFAGITGLRVENWLRPK